MTVEFKNAEVLTVGPDEILVIRLAEADGWDAEMAADMIENLKAIGLENRSVVFIGDVELTKVAR